MLYNWLKNSYLMDFNLIDLGLLYLFLVYSMDIVLRDEKFRFSIWLSFRE